ncbi:hypothetical protein [Mesomycoplasma neurolyticum]|uniref:Uncharacterized protein n=1 Tax=Mesomycoplasma neurolyticum TaxID=2120 RepID=A0A449A6M6_9BACT|nr:hypothetical protein [Mesomycoplasma neurolyticum]VEU59879.1 Uncharacterised protein [Mesomycoplasma neurolyticum]
MDEEIHINLFLDHYVIIKELFPIIISSVDTELTKWDKEEFDYAILDESSQILLKKQSQFYI